MTTKHQLYEYAVYDSNSNYELIIAHNYEIVDGYVSFNDHNVGFVASFYKPVSVNIRGIHEDTT